jgi:hypothetical protein
MPDQPNFNVHDINVRHQTTPDGKGGFGTTKIVTFSVGEHGPFQKTYSEADGTSARIKSDIQAQVAELQDINSIAG